MNYNNCTRCQFFHIVKKQTFEFNKETYNYDVKTMKPEFVCNKDINQIKIESPNSFCCDNFLIKDDEEFVNVVGLMKKFEEKGW